MKILVTGFKPFLGQALNPSEILSNELALLFDEVESQILPVQFGKSFELVRDSIKNNRPDYLIMIGQAGGRKNICFEKIGINWVQTEVKDESGNSPLAGRLCNEAPLALMPIFPIESSFLHLKKLGFPVEISFSAGTYVCNELYFRVLKEFGDLKSVFIHVPFLPEQIQVGKIEPSLSFDSELACLRAMIEFLVKDSDVQKSK